MLGWGRSCGRLTSLKLLGVQSAGVGQELRGTNVTEVARGTEFWGGAEVAGTDVTEVARGTEFWGGAEVAETDVTEVARGTEFWGGAEVAGD